MTDDGGLVEPTYCKANGTPDVWRAQNNDHGRSFGRMDEERIGSSGRKRVVEQTQAEMKIALRSRMGSSLVELWSPERDNVDA